MPRTSIAASSRPRQVHDRRVLDALRASPNDRVIVQRDPVMDRLRINVNGRTLSDREVAEFESRMEGARNRPARPPARIGDISMNSVTFANNGYFYTDTRPDTATLIRERANREAQARAEMDARRQRSAQMFNTWPTFGAPEPAQRAPRPAPAARELRSGELGSIDHVQIRPAPAGDRGIRNVPLPYIRATDAESEDRMHTMRVLAADVRAGRVANPAPVRVEPLNANEFVEFNYRLATALEPPPLMATRERATEVKEAIDAQIERLDAAGFTVHTIALKPRYKTAMERFFIRHAMDNVGTPESPRYQVRLVSPFEGCRLIADEEMLEDFLIAVKPT